MSVRLAEPLSHHTAMRTGGPCEAFVVAHDEASVLTVLADCKAAGWKVTVVGSGTRSIFRDGPMEGVVLRLGAGFVGCRFVEPDLVFIGAATPVPAVLAFAASRGLSAPDVLAAIPGTFGASVLYESWPVRTLRLGRHNGVREVEGRPVGSRLKGVVLGGTVQLRPVGIETARRHLTEAAQACEIPPGSWVDGVAGVRAVLRKASLDRVRLRQVAIPLEAPELMLNLGGGTAQDLHLLHKSAIERVKKTRGVSLRTRVRWVGKRSS